MKTVRIKKDELIAVIKANRESHWNDYREAYGKFLKQGKELLAKRHDEFVHCMPSLTLNFSITAPLNYLHQYDRILEMLAMETESTVTLDQTEFRQYVQDDWAWKDSYNSSKIGYA